MDFPQIIEKIADKCDNEKRRRPEACPPFCTLGGYPQLVHWFYVELSHLLNKSGNIFQEG